MRTQPGRSARGSTLWGVGIDASPAPSRPGRLAGPAGRAAARRGRTPARWPTPCGRCRPSRRWCSPGSATTSASRLAAAARGEAFVLQGGDCAETFDGATPTRSAASSRRILQMAVVLTYGASMPVVKIGRMAGQYAKPRSSDDETRDGVTLPSYRGDVVNGFAFTRGVARAGPAAAGRGLPREPRDAEPRARVHPGRVRRPAPGARVEPRLRGRTPASARYEQLAGEIDRALRFMARLRRRPRGVGTRRLLRRHEALLLDYERRADPHRLAHRARRTTSPATSSGSASGPASSTARTSTSPRRIRNPIGVKLGPTATPDDVLRADRPARPRPRARAG